MSVVAILALILVRGGATLFLLYLLYTALRYYSGKGQVNAVAALETYFRTKVYPRRELSDRWKKIKPANVFATGKEIPGAGQPTEYGRPDSWEEVEAELSSPYFQRTGQRLKSLASTQPLNSWYGEEAWIRDILAEKASWNILCRPFRKQEKPSTEKKAGKAAASGGSTTTGKTSTAAKAAGSTSASGKSSTTAKTAGSTSASGKTGTAAKTAGSTSASGKTGTAAKTAGSASAGSTTGTAVKKAGSASAGSKTGTTTAKAAGSTTGTTEVPGTRIKLTGTTPAAGTAGGKTASAGSTTGTTEVPGTRIKLTGTTPAAGTAGRGTGTTTGTTTGSGYRKRMENRKDI